MFGAAKKAEAGIFGIFPVLEAKQQMESRVAVMGIIVEEPESVERLNAVLHEYAAYIIGRMGIPYREKHIYVIAIVLDAPQDVISALSGKIGAVRGISVKTAYSHVITHE